MSDKPITLAEAERLEAIAAKATPGPWREGTTNVWNDERLCCIADISERRTYNAQYPDIREQRQDDCKFIAESRTALPALIAQHKSAMELLEREHGRLAEDVEPQEWGSIACIRCLNRETCTTADSIRSWRGK